MPNSLTILNYHYVRPLARTRFPEIKGCDLDQFVTQVRHIQSSYSVIAMEELIECLDTPRELPINAALLTFDDGFADHYEYVLPVLHSMGLTGCFYPPALAIMERRLLDVHKVHFLLAGGPDPKTICTALDEMIRERQLGDVVEFSNTYRHPSNRDSADVIYVKRMLQRGLLPHDRSEISSSLFAKFVSADEQAFAGELYCSLDQLRLMATLGMHIGSHGYEHLWFSTLDATQQRQEMSLSLEFLDLIYRHRNYRPTICYPYGDYNDDTKELAQHLGFELGLADHHGAANLSTDDRWALPRVSTSDFLVS
jgi:peptidoglycan/xylan/chitin deacetylase (PgdA/CDA1 family)